MQALIADADVVVNNFRAGVMERMGFGYEELPAHQPAHHLRRRHRAIGLDRPLCPQGRAGRAGAGAVRRDGAPCRTSSVPIDVYPTTLADYSAGMHLVQGILLALLQRGEDRPRPAGRVLAVRFHARGADAGSRLVHDARTRGELGRHAAHRRVRDHRRRAGDGRRLQGQSAAGHLHGAGPRRPLAAAGAAHPDRPGRQQARRCRRSSASASPPTPPRTGWRGSRSRTCSARRCARCRGARRRADGDQRHDPGEDHATLGPCASWLARAPVETRPTFRRAGRSLGAHTAEVLAELGYSAEAVEACARRG